MIACTSLTVGYSGRPVLREVSLSAKAGEILVLIGVNGCGKTTLLRTVAGLLAPISGTVTYDGEGIHRKSPHEMALCRAFFAQKHHTPDMTVRKLIESGRFPHRKRFSPLSSADREAVERSMTELGIADLADRPMKKLSGGQQQLAHFAMTLAQDTDILLLDEPTTYLDIRNRRHIFDAVKERRNQGKTVIMTLQSIEEALTVADRVAVLGSGRLEAVGTPDEIVACGAIQAVFGATVEKAVTADGTEHYFVK